MTDVAVITGGASGFGRALGHGCAARGMSVVLLDLDGDRAGAEAATLASVTGVAAFGMGVDVADGASVEGAAATVGERFGRVDLVISNVGVQLFAPIDRATDDEWRWVLDVNVVGSARVARAFLPLLRTAPRGRLAFTSSSSVLDPASRMSMYQSSKFAVWGLAETLRVELADDGIGVSVIFPSGMRSRHLETSEAAQPGHIRRPIAGEDDFIAMHGSNPTMAEFLATPEEAATGVVDAILVDRRYIVTHGEFLEALETRHRELRRRRSSRGKRMKVLVPVAFDGDRDAFPTTAVEQLTEVVGSGAASGATVDVRLPDSELEALGPQLMSQQEERAVIALWDTDAETALSISLPGSSRRVGAYEVEEVVQKDYDRTWPSGTRSPGFKMIAFLHRRVDLTQEGFSQHWRERHGPLAVARQPGFWHYVQNHLVSRLTDASPHWDGFGEIHYRTVEDALTRSFDSEEAQQLIREDVARFLDYDRSRTLTTHEWVVTIG